MGVCNCLRTNAIIHDMDTGPKKTRELISQFKGNPNLLFILKRVQARLRGMMVRNQVKVKALANRRMQPIQDIQNNKISHQELREILNLYPSLNDNITVTLRNLVEESKGVYYGEWNANTNQKHGRGIQVWIDGSRYEGLWQNDKANIKGKLIHSGGDYYEGEWLNDKANGYGTYYHIDGAQYEGYWKEDKQEGNGIEKWPDGSLYEGEFRDGKKCGIGLFKWVDGSNYKGQFNNNQINGKGVYIWKDRRKYEGDWVDNKMEGKGVFSWPDNRKYVGEYRNDKKEGYGVFEWGNGKIFKGYWKGGKQHGEGEFFNPKTNECKKGVWENGKRMKWIDD